MSQPSYQTFLVPTKLIHGRGCRRAVPEELRSRGGSRALLVTDKGIRGAGIADEMAGILADGGVPAVIFDEVIRDARVRTVERARDVAVDAGCDCVVGMGGGSVLVSAKAIAMLCTNGGSFHDYVGWDKARKPSLPVAALTTTAGSGSEVSQFVPVKDEELGEKLLVGSPHCFPSVAILDPELLLSLPFWQAVLSGLDALTHAIEAYISTLATPITDALALGALEMLFASLPKSVRGQDLDAKETALVGSTMANLACGHARLNLAHAMLQPISGLFEISYGQIIGTLLPYAMEFNLAHNEARFARMASAMGVGAPGASQREAAEEAVRGIKRLLVEWEFPRKFSPDEVDPAAIPQMARQCAQGSLIQYNRRRVSEEELAALYRRTFEGWTLDEP